MNVKEWKFKQVKQRFKIAYYLNHLGLCRNLFSAGLAQTLPLNPILNQVFSYHFKLLRKLYNPKSSSTRNKHSFMNLKKIYCLPVNWITAIEQDNLSTNLYASLSFITNANANELINMNGVLPESYCNKVCWIFLFRSPEFLLAFKTNLKVFLIY